MSENTEKNTGYENLIPWKAGDPSPNPNGRPKGQKNYATIYREALIRLGTELKKTPDELEVELIRSGLLNAKKGDYRFYKDVLDRAHGTAIMMSRVDHSGEVKVNSTINFDELITEADELLKQKKLNAKQTDKGGSGI